MFDYYEPIPQIPCPFCNKILEWQGKDGPCALFLWRQGDRAPAGQRAGESNVAKQRLQQFRLPDQFEIYAHCCNQPFPIEAVCETIGEIWQSTNIITAVNAVQGHNESRATFKDRLNWLAKRDA